jgi:uncharacterized protein YgiM (DUF1202 family)
MLVTGASATSIGGGTTKTGVNFRTGASTSSSVIATIPAGTTVIVTDGGGGWYRAVYNGTEGYLSGDYVTFDWAMNGSFGTGTVTATSVNLRNGAGLNSGVIGSVNTGATMKIVGVNHNWYKVEYNGQTAYISSDYVKVSGGSGSASPAPAQGGGQTGGSSGTVKGDYVRMRSGPGTGYAILGTYNTGTALTINGTESGWTKVTIGGVNGYIRSDYVAAGGSSSQGGGTTSKTGYINGTSVRMRSGPNTSSTILGVYNTGTSMTITGESGNWYAVSYNGQNGYVCKDYMTTSSPSSAPAASATEGYVKGNSVRLRSGPGTGYSILGAYNNATPLTITGTSGDWTAVTINGLKGYMSSAYVTTSKPTVTSANPSSVPAQSTEASSTAERVVATAKQYLGYPYVYGGMSPSGFDCSGFAGYVYKQCGYSLKRTARDIFYNNGTSVDKANLRAGDLVFFSNSSETIGHVGIYIGGNQFIHASSSTVGVIISDLTSSYYVSHYQGAKRIIQCLF